MKIGVCLSGHYRNFDYNYESWEKYLFSKYDCDVFLHTWDVMGNRDKGDDVGFEERVDRLNYTEQELKQRYKFTDVVIQKYGEPLEEFKEKSKRVRQLRDNAGISSVNGMDWTKRRITHLYSMWYKALKCFELLETYSTDYDLIIKCRPDIRLSDSFNLDDIDLECINWPWYNSKQEHYSEPHDYYAVGNFHNMKIYNNLYNHIEEMESVLEIEKTTRAVGTNVEIPGVDRFLNPHTLLFFYTKHMGLQHNTIINHLELMRG
jgi:hypothetical protein